MKRVLAVLFAAALLSACGSNAGSAPKAEPTIFEPAIAPGPEHDAVRYGYELIVDTRKHMKRFVKSNMDCQACHVDGGTKAKGGSFVGIYAEFPQWNKRAHRMIALQDRLAECFLYSMNGRPPAYNSPEMIAMVSYIAYLSRNAKVGATPDPSAVLAHFDPPKAADPLRGAQLYAQRCEVCHGKTGDGHNGAFPPLWGSHSFNNGAGMHRLWTMAGFVRYNMPKNAPGTLTDQQAYDVAAFVLSHARPHFDKRRAVQFPPQDAAYF